MDIKNNQSLAKFSLKDFALKATASAILTLNAEHVIAGTCSDVISTDMAGVICDFSAPQLSLTVANGGTISGIVMTGYAPVSSQISILSGGLINNTSTSTNIGISIISSSLTNGISNSGTISTVSNNISIASASAIEGGISNTGVMRSDQTNIRIDVGNTIVGGMTNNGTIMTTSANNPAISFIQLNSIQGDIVNNGLIRAAGTGNGIHINSQNLITGSLYNNGVILAGGTGIRLFPNNQVLGDVINNGLIVSPKGVSITNQSIVGGDIINNGSILSTTMGLNLSSQVEVSGGISNTGTIFSLNTGIAVSSTASLSGGISNSGTIQGIAKAIVIDATSSVNNINILGQSARIIGSVDAANTDVNLTSGSSFTSEGAFVVHSFNINSNANFNMAHVITAQDAVNNSGILSVGHTARSVTVGGYTQNTGGVFQTEVVNESNYGQLSVDSGVDLSQSGNINVQITPNSSLHQGEIFTNILSGGSLIAPTDGWNVSDNSFIWEFIASVNSIAGVDLAAAINPAAYTVCQGQYCQGAATAILSEIAAGNALFSSYASQSTANELVTAASQATPELTNENNQIVQLITRAVEDVVPMWGSLRGQSAGDALLAQPGKVWIKPYGATMSQKEHTSVQGFQATAYGAVIGKDGPWSEDGLLGGAFAVGGDSMQGKSVLNGQSINSTAYQGMLYGAQRFPNYMYVAGQGLIGYENNHTQRLISIDSSTAKGAYNSWFTNIRGELGWSIYALTHDLVLTPEVDASYLFISQGGYQESGSPMDLKINLNNNSSLVLGAYCNGAYHLPAFHAQQNLTLTGYGGMAGDVLNNQPQVLSTFVASGSSFSTFGVQFNGMVFRGGAGLAISSANSPLRIDINYDVQVGNSAFSGIGAATVKYKV